MSSAAWIQFAKDVRAAWQRLWPSLPGPKARLAAPAQGRTGVPSPRHRTPAQPAMSSWSMVQGLDPATPWARELAALYADSASFPTSISPQVGMLLHALTLNHRPRVAVDVGSFLGASTLWIASALEPGATLHAVDRFELSRSAARRPPTHRPSPPGDLEAAFRARLGRAVMTDRIRVHVGESPRLLAQMRRELLDAGGVDLAFIDADHTIPGVVRDFWAIEPALAPGAIVIFHNTEPLSGHEGPRYVVDALQRGALGVGSRFEITQLPIAPMDFGVAIARKLED